jgi:D-galactose 1-dehydrogenase
MKRPIRIAIVGVGKIARDQHIPAIMSNADFELAALVSRSMPPADVPVYANLQTAFDSGIAIDAVAICAPPIARLNDCRKAFSHGCAVLLEKPPATTVNEALDLKRMADASGVPVFASWHSRFAPMVEAAKAWCVDHPLRIGRITWHEDAAKWHPGQDWLWRAGGFGVFDPGINALSILTSLYPSQWCVEAVRFDVPANVDMPVSAQFELVHHASKVQADFDFRPTPSETWTIHVEATNGETLDIVDGGAGMSLNGAQVQRGVSLEYAGLYRRFSDLVQAGVSDFDVSPLAIVESAFAAAHISRVEPISN